MIKVNTILNFILKLYEYEIIEPNLFSERGRR